MTVKLMAERPVKSAHWLRLLLWGLAGLAFVIALPVAFGLVGARIDAGADGPWRDRLVTVGFVLAIGILAAIVCNRLVFQRLERRSADAGEGVRREAARQRTFWRWTIAMGALGAVVGALISGDAILAGGWSPALGVVLALAYLVAIIGGTVVMFRRMDELEQMDNVWAGSTGAGAVVIVYPAWYFLWRGGLVPEPSHEALFFILCAVSGSVYLSRKSNR